uniref:Uncharacterized protein n=1 Tax=Rhizophora mucronata TaxID=61149 RepID=A0A2P2PFA4_RHIMU
MKVGVSLQPNLEAWKDSSGHLVAHSRYFPLCFLLQIASCAWIFLQEILHPCGCLSILDS